MPTLDRVFPAEELQAEDVSQSVDRQDDPPWQLQLLLQESSHLLRVENVTEHPDLRPLPLDVGVTRRQPGAPDGPAQSPPHLQGGGPTVGVRWGRWWNRKHEEDEEKKIRQKDKEESKQEMQKSRELSDL